MPDSQKKYDVIVDGLTAQPNVARGKMMGMSCVKVNGNMCMGFWENDMVFKLKGDDHTAALKLKGAKLFDPSGMKRPMKEWVQIPAAHTSRWGKFAEAALKYVSTLPSKCQ